MSRVWDSIKKMRQRTINIDKVIREIERIKPDVICYDKHVIISMCLQIIKDNIKEDKSPTTYTYYEFKKKFFPKKYKGE